MILILQIVYHSNATAAPDGSDSKTVQLSFCHQSQIWYGMNNTWNIVYEVANYPHDLATSPY